MIAGKQFRPSPWAAVIVILMLVLLLGLGIWQMNRSQEKQSLLDNFKQAPAMPDVELAEIGADWESYRYRRLTLTGQYDAQHQILLQNQVRQGRQGYFVLTPFIIDNNSERVLVNRGWMPQPDSLETIPDIIVSDSARTLSGLINHPPAVGMRIGSLDDSAAGWPKRLPYVDTEWLSLQLGKQVKPWVVLLGADQDDGYVRQWQPSVRMTPEKHQGYAFQWFSLAIALIFLFIAGSMKPGAKAVTDTIDQENEKE